MIALVASALLGLYIFAPYIIFHRICSFFIRLKKFERSKTDEVVVGIVVAGLPFALTLLLSWSGLIGGSLVPFPIDDTHLQKVVDYRTVFTAAYSEHYFTEHQPESWEALKRVCKRQADFLAWNYAFLLGETSLFIALVSQFGKWKTFKPYAWLASRVLLPTVSEWHVLLTDFNFPPEQERSVEVDVMSKDDILYRGEVLEYFLSANGQLSGLLLHGTERFQYEKLKEDRKSKQPKRNIQEYWRPIAGAGNFYIPAENVASLNIRYPSAKVTREQFIKDLVQRLFNAKVEAIPTPEESQAGDLLIPGTNQVEGKKPDATPS
jgi:hypothetical protein